MISIARKTVHLVSRLRTGPSSISHFGGYFKDQIKRIKQEGT
jgi:hypothetical protein